MEESQSKALALSMVEGSHQSKALALSEVESYFKVDLELEGGRFKERWNHYIEKAKSFIGGTWGKVDLEEKGGHHKKAEGFQRKVESPYGKSEILLQPFLSIPQ